MNRHLGEEDICRWIAGERGVEAERHLGNCGLCRSHVARMSETLDGFHAMVRDRSEQRLGGYGALDVAMAEQHAARGWNGLGWGKLTLAALATALVILVATAVWAPRHAPHHTASALGVDDAALLTRVDAEVSRTVPGPMEPLAALIEWRPESQKAVQSRTDQGSPNAQQD